MASSDDSESELLKKLLDERRELRRDEKTRRREFKKEVSTMGMQEELKAKLPARLVPGNVGTYQTVRWPYIFNLVFDFGDSPVLNVNTAQTQSFQVPNEAAFLLYAIYRKSWNYDVSGELGPYQMTFRDRQSSRQFNDNPVPIQVIGKRSKPFIFPIPFLIMPNANFDVLMTSFSETNMPTVGASTMDFAFAGRRIRVGDIPNVMNQIFGKK